MDQSLCFALRTRLLAYSCLTRVLPLWCFGRSVYSAACLQWCQDYNINLYVLYIQYAVCGPLNYAIVISYPCSFEHVRLCLLLWWAIIVSLSLCCSGSTRATMLAWTMQTGMQARWNWNHVQWLSFMQIGAQVIVCILWFSLTLEVKMPYVSSCIRLQPAPTSRFVKGYLGAVTSAVGIAVSGGC